MFVCVKDLHTNVVVTAFGIALGALYNDHVAVAPAEVVPVMAAAVLLQMVCTYPHIYKMKQFNLYQCLHCWCSANKILFISLLSVMFSGESDDSGL